MWFSLTICTGSIAILVLVIRTMRAKLDAHLKRLTKEQNAIEEKYLFTKRRNKELKAEIAALQNALTLISHNIHSTASSLEKDAAAEDDTLLISRHMLTKGLLTVEQNENALKKMETLNMDFLGTCLALGYIDLDKARGVVKSLNLHQSPLFAEK